ncbi:MAG: peptidyl-prolyl cis-trans isomerase [Rubricoccaceae bacterium]
MGMMTKMRESTGAVIGVLVFAFGGLWVLQDSGAFDAVGRNVGMNVGKVNGEPIPTELFNNALQQETDRYQQQGIDVTPALRAQLENQTFDALVDNALVEAEMDRLGIQVTDEEVFALITGPRPDPVLASYFPDGSGGINRALLDQVVNDPAYATELNAIEEQVRRNRRQAKLSALIGASARVSDAEVDAEIARRGRTATAQVVALRYAEVPESDVEVSDDDLQEYYREHREDFERPETYTAEYVSFNSVASAEDSSRVLGELGVIRPGLETAEDPAAYVASQSYGTETEAAFVPPSQLPDEVATAIYEDLTVGRVVGPIVGGGQATLARITGVRDAESPLLRARHILFPEGQEDQARDVKARIENGEVSFAAAARRLSEDGSKDQGGDLGWFGRGQMVAPFEQAAFAAPIGQVVGPVVSQFGVHLIEVTGRADQEAEIVQITRPIEGDYDRTREAAEDFVAIAVEGENRTFEEAAQEAGMEITPIRVQADQASVPGLDAGRPLFRFLKRAEPGDLSDPIDAGDRFVIVRLVETMKEGVAPFEDVRDQIELAVRLEKKAEIQVERLRQAIRPGASLDQIASSAGAPVQTVEALSQSRPSIQGFGNEPRAVGAVFGLQPNQRSGAIEGDQAAFIVSPVSFTDADAMDEAGREQLRQQLLQAKRQRLVQGWIRSLREKADVEDLRNDVL